MTISECISKFHSFKNYGSGELVKHNEADKGGMGHTLDIGSFSSEVYFCCYEKNYEQYAKLGIPIDEVPIKNRLENKCPLVLVHWRGTTVREVDNKARALHIGADAQLATKAGCPNLENVEEDRQGQSDRLST